MALIGDVAIGRIGTFMVISELEDSRRCPDSDLLPPVPVLTTVATLDCYVIIKQISRIDDERLIFYVGLVPKRIRQD
jgi:hypothetical protein